MEGKSAVKRNPLTLRGMILIGVIAGVTACGGGGSSSSDNGETPVPQVPDEPLPEPAVDWSRDILSTRLKVDVSTHEAVAVIEVAGSESSGLSLEIGDLRLQGVGVCQQRCRVH